MTLPRTKKARAERAAAKEAIARREQDGLDEGQPKRTIKQIYADRKKAKAEADATAKEALNAERAAARKEAQDKEIVAALDLVSQITLRQVPLERMLISEHGFGLTTASPLQRAICRIIDGRPLGELANTPLLKNADAYSDEIRERATLAWSIGDISKLPAVKPAEIYIVGPVRSGKSLIAATIALCASQRCDVSRLGFGEMPRASVVSLNMDLAKVVYQHIAGHVYANENLKRLLVSEPTVDSIVLAHPDGIPVEIKIVAGSRAGGSLVARWSAGAFFDEFTRMIGGDDGVINFDDARSAVSARLLRGAQIVGIGSPWAPFGPAYQLVNKHWGEPSHERVVIRAVGPAMNPEWWTPERCEELRSRDYTAYRTDVLGEFAQPEESMFATEDLAAVTRKYPLELAPQAGNYYVAAIDPATRGDTFTLVVTTRDQGGKSTIVLAREWRGSSSSPLSPAEVFREIARILEPYQCFSVVSDQWAADALHDLAMQHGIYLRSESITAAKKVDMFESLKTLILAKRIELSPLPELQQDLRRVGKKVTQTGISIDLPRVGRRHCDFAFAAALAFSQPMGLPAEAAELPPNGWATWEVEEADQLARLLRHGRGEVNDMEAEEMN
mgnify:CR=1 FL=1